MSSRPLVDPEILPLLDVFGALGVSAATLPDLRAMILETAEDAVPPSDQVVVSEQSIAGPSGSPDIRVLIYQPVAAATERPALLHIHGGGYVMGRPDMNDVRNRQLAEELDIVIVSVDYRLAPETVHPGPVEDCYAALKWIYDTAPTLGIDRKRIAIGGESAGGGLTASLALLARDRAEVHVAFQLLIYPMLDDRTGTTIEADPLAGEFVWTTASNRFGWRSLLGAEPGGPDTSPYAAAARAESLAGLPPTFISVGALDLFRDENIDYAKRLMHAGVPTEFHIYPGAFHGFNRAAAAAISKNFVKDYFGALGRALTSTALI